MLTGLILSTALAGAASADTIRVWTMEVQPERMEIQQQMADAFEAATGHVVDLIPIEESDIQTPRHRRFAAGESAGCSEPHRAAPASLRRGRLLDTAAADEVVNDLGIDTFAEGPIRDGVKRRRDRFGPNGRLDADGRVPQ